MQKFITERLQSNPSITPEGGLAPLTKPQPCSERRLMPR
jgi:hypothetical protein